MPAPRYVLISGEFYYPAQLPTGARGHLHDLYQADANCISQRLLPEQLIFLE